ncbi:phage integrase-related [Anaeramoeba flamelloides]|uniref:Phage integrase-related n=2 Tax=Anaeramoeba flamelloides TaxID=1746091 RepID=A0ABQ8XG78_9EUKA|nr:phage integrase-related [Anaeramoeba flamelloides]
MIKKKIIKSSQELIEESEKGYINKNTKRMQECVAKRFKNFLQEKEETRELTMIPLKDLDCHIVVFISRMTKLNDESYSWNSFRTMVHCLMSYLRRVWQKKELEDYPTLEKLHRTQSTLDRNLNRLKEENNVGKHTPWLTLEEEDRFLSSLNLKDPYDLLVCAFWLTGTFTGFRGGEYFQILQKDISWENEDGDQFIKIIQRKKKQSRKGIKDSEGMFFTGHQSKSGYNCYKRQDKKLNKKIAKVLCHRSKVTEKEKTIKQVQKRKRFNNFEKKFDNEDDDDKNDVESPNYRNFNDIMGNIKLINCSNINFNFNNERK